ncbi:MAG: DUF4282 domain-containing protein [Microcella sp.]|uniref:DUF4282 domain-containing protein n=1 Tax=Microcella sp. TaxID=1913979 RepID=UPI0024C6C9FE|nr:DUF4282 domain-containing protein [Microcella sp.]UYN83377.1 MAG: DUF4282 domain-containing protein [Microcella sp.]
MTDSPTTPANARKPKTAAAAPTPASPPAATPAEQTLSLDVSAVPGFFKALVDFRFTTFITRRIAGFIYGILLISILLAGLVTFFSVVVMGVGLMTGPVNAQPISGILTILGALVLVPIATLVAIVLARMLVEVNVALVAIAENTAGLRK